jgi:hypothetical protein
MAPTRSDLEDLVLDVIIQGGLERPDVNKPLPSGYIPDFRWPEQRLILEADGAAWHDHPIARADDATRQAHLEARGERVVRVSWAEAMADPSRIVQRLRSAGAPAAARVRGWPGSDPAPRR